MPFSPLNLTLLNSHLTPAVYIIAALLNLLYTILLSPIECAVPEMAIGSTGAASHLVQYITTHCWMREQQRHDPFSFSYQSLSIVLVIMALPFLMPYAIWSTMTTHSGMRLQSMLRSLRPDHRASIDKFVNHMHNAQRFYSHQYRRRALATFCCQTCMKVPIAKTYNTIIFLLCLLLQFVIAAIQFHIVNSIILAAALRPSSLLAQLDDADRYLWSHLNVTRFQHSRSFPTEAECEFQMNEPMGGLTTYKFICLLPINVLNQRMFVFLYMWLLIAMMTSLITIIYAFYCLLYPPNRRWFVLMLLELSDAHFDCKGDVRRLYRFLEDNLGVDGVLTIRLVVAKYGVLVGAQICGELWSRYHDDMNDHNPLLDSNKNSIDMHQTMPIIQAPVKILFDSGYGGQPSDQDSESTATRTATSQQHQKMLQYLNKGRLSHVNERSTSNSTDSAPV